MVIVKLIGGLGNQMFQYAAGRRLAHVLGVELKLDISAFNSYKLRKYCLGTFNIQESFATLDEITALTKPRFVERMRAKALRRPPRPPKTYIREKKNFHFDPDIMNLPDGVYLEGYWQSEKYFSEISDIIRKEFAVKVTQTGENKVLAEQITSSLSVSLHIRRGDYVSNPRTNLVHGICGMDYYLRCVEFIADKVKEPHFFVFSDDPQWVRKNLNLAYRMTVINHNGVEKDYEDLRLVSQCKHHIIANSTFSWWGAWLSHNSNKVILAPKVWANNDYYDVKDLIPEKCILADQFRPLEMR
jgi:hypothetical protein